VGRCGMRYVAKKIAKWMGVGELERRAGMKNAQNL